MSKVSSSLQERFLEKFLLENHIIKSKVEDVLNDALNLNGITAVSLIDLKSGILLGSMSSSDLNIEFASILNNSITEKVKKMSNSIDPLAQESINNIVFVYKERIEITYRTEISKDRELYFYIVVDPEKTNLFIIKNKIEVILNRLKQ
ncbi:MAG: hypothetical protein DRG30_04010 [Epsilonproteobacteria bacterium]|nr:MAG: hypothetical protein DRG30_04010 [Campylobacterota bacterium]